MADIVGDGQGMMQGRDLEVRAQLVLQRHYGCPVELSPPGPDVGRDLIVRHPDGVIVVECKDWSEKRAGRAIVQKLHSATRTMNSRRALLICTSGFTPQAQEYAASLQDIDLELWDGGRFEALAASVGLTSTGDAAATAQLVPPDDDFARIVTMGILAPRAGRHPSVDAVDRHVEWVALYAAGYRAEGNESRTNHDFRRTWTGTVWIDPRDQAVRTGPLPNVGAPLVQAGTIVGDGASPVVTPRATHAEANEVMRSYLLANLSHTETYTGGNNQRYSVTVTPKSRLTALEPIQTIYVPVQQLRVSGPASTWIASFSQLHDAEGRLTGLSIDAEHLGTCATCHGALTTPSHLLCAVCHRGLHAPILGLRRHARQCSSCGANTCSDHTVEDDNGESACTTCAPTGRPTSRTHLLAAAVSAAVGLVLATLTALLVSWEAAGLVGIIALAPGAIEAAATLSRGHQEVAYPLAAPLHLRRPASTAAETTEGRAAPNRAGAEAPPSPPPPPRPASALPPPPPRARGSQPSRWPPPPPVGDPR